MKTNVIQWRFFFLNPKQNYNKQDLKKKKGGGITWNKTRYRNISNMLLKFNFTFNGEVIHCNLISLRYITIYIWIRVNDYVRCIRDLSRSTWTRKMTDTYKKSLYYMSIFCFINHVCSLTNHGNLLCTVSRHLALQWCHFHFDHLKISQDDICNQRTWLLCTCCMNTY